MLQHKDRKPISYIQREANAKQRQQERQEYNSDPVVILTRHIRAEHLALSDIRRVATKAWEAANAAVPLPRQLAGGLVHPTRLAALLDLVKDWSEDPREPIVRVQSLDELEAEMSTDIRANIDLLNAEYEAAVAQKHEDDAEDSRLLTAAVAEGRRLSQVLHNARPKPPALPPIAVEVGEDAPVRPGRSG